MLLVGFSEWSLCLPEHISPPGASWFCHTFQQSAPCTCSGQTSIVESSSHWSDEWTLLSSTFYRGLFTVTVTCKGAPWETQSVDCHFSVTSRHPSKACPEFRSPHHPAECWSRSGSSSSLQTVSRPIPAYRIHWRRQGSEASLETSLTTVTCASLAEKVAW